MGAEQLVVVGSGLLVLWLVWKWFCAPSAVAPTATKAAAAPKPVGPFSVEQVAKHCSRDDAWMIIDGLVYDVTEFVDDHPGGDSILNQLGRDATAQFHGDQHPPTVKDAVEEFFIGELKKEQ